MRLPHVVELLNATTTTVDAFGNDQPNWAGAITTTTRGFIQPRSGREDTQNRDVQISDHVLFFTPGEPVDGRSRVRVGGDLYEVVGPPRLWRGVSPLDRVELRRIEG